MNQEIQVGKYEFYPNEFSDEREKLLIELELLSLNDEQREKRRMEILRNLANIKPKK
jgi:hypothetical protein